MSPQKQLKLHQCKRAFERQIDHLRRELVVCTRVDHLQPALDFLEWLVRDMADLAGVTAEVTAFAKMNAAIRDQVTERATQLTRRALEPRKPQRPKLRLVKS